MSGMTGSSYQSSSSSSREQRQREDQTSGLTAAQQQLLAAAGTSLTSVGGKEYGSASRASTPSNTYKSNSGTPARPPAPSTPTTPMSMTLPPMTSFNGSLDPASQTKYQQLLSVIEEMSKDIRPCYAGSKSSAERLKRGIVYARILVSNSDMNQRSSAQVHGKDDPWKFLLMSFKTCVARFVSVWWRRRGARGPE